MPTATQKFTATHETDDNSFVEFGTFGLDTKDHDVPFQMRVSVPSTAFVSTDPTATHHDSDVHDTADRKLVVPPGFGTDISVHENPSHLMAKFR